ncbi:MAG: LamG domain-containing protein [Candidatus Sumerlaeaceae bacterium]|nr:LamG domain-containing protein [Candidatus Sumerlaeaceae bacterium]
MAAGSPFKGFVSFWTAACLINVYLLPHTSYGGASQYSLRFYGTGTFQQDRVKIKIDAPQVPADIGAGSFSIEFWMKGTAAANTTPNHGYRVANDTEEFASDWISGNIIIDRDIFGPGPDWGISVHRNGVGSNVGVLRFGTEGAAGGDAAHTLQTTGGVNLLDGAWHHVCVVRDVTTGRKHIYLDGMHNVSSGPGVSDDNISYPNGYTDPSWPWNPYIVFGAEKHDYDPSSYPSFSGWLDEVRLWNIALTPTQVAAYMNSTVAPGTPGLVAMYRFEEGNGTTINDTSGGGSHGTLTAGIPGNGEWSTDTPSSFVPVGISLFELH